jgi:hypothetical protein
MSEFVKEDDDRQDEQKGNGVADQAMAYRIDSMLEKLSHRSPIARAWWLAPRKN